MTTSPDRRYPTVQSIILAERVEQQTGFLPAVSTISQWWWRQCPEFYDAGDDLVAFPEYWEELEDLVLSVEDLRQREGKATLYAWLRAGLIGLAHALASACPERGSDARELLLRLLHDGTEGIPSLARLRWELYAAVEAGDLGRVVDLAGVWPSLDPDLAFGDTLVRSIFWLLMNRTDEEPPALDPAIGTESLSYPEPLGSDLGALLASLQAENVIAELDCTVPGQFVSASSIILAEACDTRALIAPALDQAAELGTLWPQTLAPEAAQKPGGGAGSTGSDDSLSLRVQATRLCLGLLEHLALTRTDNPPHLVAVKAWCHLALGLIDRTPGEIAGAARLYSVIGSQDALGLQERVHALRAAVRCFTHLADLGEAERWVRELIAVQPQDADAYRWLAELLDKQGRRSEAVEAFEGYVRRAHERPEDEWVNTFALSLGLEVIRDKGTTAAMEAAALTSGWREQGQKLIEWCAPWAARLSVQTKSRWWTGLYVVSSPRLHGDLGSPVVLGMAGSCFGEAVAMELRARVFEPFFRNSTSEQLPEKWRQVADGKGSLGVLWSLLKEARSRRSIPGERLATFLQTRHPALFSLFFSSTGAQANALVALRNLATHQEGAVSEADVRSMYENASVVLKALNRT